MEKDVKQADQLKKMIKKKTFFLNTKAIRNFDESSGKFNDT